MTPRPEKTRRRRISGAGGQGGEETPRDAGPANRQKKPDPKVRPSHLETPKEGGARPAVGRRGNLVGGTAGADRRCGRPVKLISPARAPETRRDE